MLTLHVDFDALNPDDTVGRKVAARELIREACKISKTFFKCDSDEEDESGDEEHMEGEERPGDDGSSSSGDSH